MSKKSTRSNKTLRAAFFCGLASLAFPVLFAQDGTRPNTTKRKVFAADDPFLAQHRENLEKITAANQPVLRLVRKGNQEPARDDLLMDFETESLFSNPAHQSLIVKASIDREEHNGMSGRAAQFNLPEHKLKIRLPSYLHLSGSHLTAEAGDFSFACEFEPHSANGELLRRENFHGGKQFLFSIALRNNRVVVKLENLLQSGTAETKIYLESAVLKAVDKVKAGVRNLLVITYNEAEGKLTLIINDREQATRQLKRGTTDNYALSFENLKSAPLVLFTPFRGYADNILFSNRVLNGDDIRHFGALTPYGDRYNQRRGLMLSGIFDMGYSQSSITQITAELTKSRKNALTVSARCHNKRFAGTLHERDLRFEKIDTFGEKKCRFVQFKAEFTADNAGTESPHLQKIAIEYRENPPPERPVAPKILSVKDETVELEIFPNTELDVVRGGRYIVYYGHKAHQPEGGIYFKSTAMQNGQFKGEVFAHKAPIRIRIGNDTIAANKSFADKNPRFKNRYPVLENGIGYYFWVTACDNAYGEAQELQDHESQPSEAVFVRFE